MGEGGGSAPQVGLSHVASTLKIILDVCWEHVWTGIVDILNFFILFYGGLSGLFIFLF